MTESQPNPPDVINRDTQASLPRLARETQYVSPITRRIFIHRAGAAAAILASQPFGALRAAAGPNKTFSGSVSLPNGFQVPPGEVWEFDPNRSTTVVVGENVVVHGILRMRPASADIVHTLRFEGVDESKFVGGGVNVLDTDVGLWIMQSGQIDALGTPKTAWNRTGVDSTWRSTDEIRVAPTALGDFGSSGFQAFEPGNAVPSVTAKLESRNNLSFTDTEDSVHKYDIEAIYAAGITKGTGANTYSPRNVVTRGQMAAFLRRALKLPPAPSAGFTDTKGHLFEKDIDAIYAVGITKGTSATTYSPEDSTTRGQMASFLTRALGLPVPDFGTRTVAWKAEVLNLTRNVRIQGTASGRAHILIRSSAPQTLRFVEVSHMGPRQASGDHSSNVAGRYGLHFHHCGNGSRGSLVEGVVVRDTGGHAFVPHASHGITLSDCISYNTFDDAYWWDPPDDQHDNASHDIVYDHCLAGLVKTDPSFRGFTLAGFRLGQGDNPVARDCVAVGVQGNKSASGFLWPEFGEGIWLFEDCVAHNNRVSGIFTWQNTSKLHVIDRFAAYHNGKAGIDHGAYLNNYIYKNSILYRNAEYGILLHAASRGELAFADIDVEGAGTTKYLLKTSGHALPPDTTTLFSNCRLRGFATSPVLLGDTENPDKIDFVECRVSADDIAFSAGSHPESVVRVQDEGSAFAVTASGVKSISPFN